jgi:CRP-like cAMP-binding protein
LASAQKTTRNRILACLTPADFARLPLTQVDLPVRKMLEPRGRKVEHVYFLESGVASVVVSGGSRHSLEVGLVGRESMTGLAVILGAERAINETFIQAPGTGWRLAADELRTAMAQSASLRDLLLKHAHVMSAQMAFTALANGCYHIDERLARWLLMAHDRAEGPDISMTHEFLSVMLGVRRPGVTEALNELESKGVIESRRGWVTVLNRPALEDAANGSYGTPEAEYERLFGA